MNKTFDESPSIQPSLLPQADIDAADELFVSLAFGSAEEKADAAVALRQWAGDRPERLRYIADQQAVDLILDSHADALRARYPRAVPSVSARRPWHAVTWMRWSYASGALASVLAAVAFVVNPVLSTEELRSATGELTHFTLSDGTRVSLNTASSAVFESRLRTREMNLLEGEALFSIADKHWRPFKVVAKTTTIRDIGTVFSVRRIGDDVAVAVIEGAVEISIPTSSLPLRLDARETAIAYGGPNPEVLRWENYEAMISWKDRRMEFTAEPLSWLITEVQRYRKQPIRFADPYAENIRVTGGFSSADPDMLLRTLPAVAPVNVRFEADGTAVISSR